MTTPPSPHKKYTAKQVADMTDDEFVQALRDSTKAPKTPDPKTKTVPLQPGSARVTFTPPPRQP